jgi:hypothetical protein
VSNLYDKDGIPHRREIPKGSDAIAVVGFDWETINKLLSNLINDLAPAIRDPKTAWIVRATQDGLHIDFYDDRRTLEHRLYEEAQNGPQVHAGTLAWW